MKYSTFDYKYKTAFRFILNQGWEYTYYYMSY